MFNAFLEGKQKETEIQREVAVVQRERPRNEQASALAHETSPAVAGKRNRGVVSHNEDLPAVGVTHREVLELKVSIDGLAKKVNSDIDAILKLLESEVERMQTNVRAIYINCFYLGACSKLESAFIHICNTHMMDRRHT